MFRGGEWGQRTEQEVRTTETRTASLAYDVGKPLLLAILNTIGVVLVYLAAMLAVWALSQKALIYVIMGAWGLVSLCWHTYATWKYDDAWTILSLLILAIVFCAAGSLALALDELAKFYWDEMLYVTPLLAALTFLVSLLPASILESWLTSAHFEYALSQILGGHPKDYKPWWVRKSRQQPPGERPLMNKSRRQAVPELGEAQTTPAANLPEIECFLRVAQSRGALSREQLMGAVMDNGKPLTKNVWQRSVDILTEQGYVENPGSGNQWTAGNSAQTARDGLV